MPHAFFTSHVSDPDALAKRLIERAHHRDGLPEIIVGLFFLLMAGLITAQAMAPRGSVAFKAIALTCSIAIPAVCFGAPTLLKRLRRTYLMDRVGYVEYKPATRKHIAAGVLLAASTAVVLLGVVMQLSHPDPWILSGTGIFGGALVVLCGRLPRFVAGGVLIATAGIVVAAAGIPLLPGFAILFGFEGLLSLVSGLFVFLRFLHL